MPKKLNRIKTKRHKKDYISIILTIFSFIISFYAIYLVSKNQDALEHLIKSSGLMAPLVTIFLYGVLSLTPIPSDPLTLISGALFGPVLGIFTSWMGNNFAALIEYIVGRGVSAIADFEEKKKKLPWGLDKLPVNSPWFLIGGRFAPGFGSKIVSVMAGVYGVSVFHYIWTAAVANIVGSVVYVFWGVGLINLFH